MATEQKEDLSIDDPDFYERAFTLAAHERKVQFTLEPDNFKRVCAEEYTELTRRLDKSKLQESCAVRNVLRTRRLANLLINDKGELNIAVLPKVINHLTTHLYSLGPDRQYDTKRQEHLLQVITLLSTTPELQRLLKSVDKPVSHKYADQIIRDTLALPHNTPVTDAHARRAALSAWMCLLRQNVGSCFATAPAIIVQSEQPQQFFRDLIDILGTGRLKRTFGGIEYTVPLSTSWGAGDLKRPFGLPLGEAFEESNLWLNPGLLDAFEVIGLVDPEAELDVKDKKVKEILKDYVLELPQKQGVIFTSAEEILNHIVLNHLKITEKDLQEYENRPKTMMQSNLMMQAPVGGGKTDACANYYILFDEACDAFKALADNALLKAWEFTLASFSETKAQFTRWNLYSSLGLGTEEKGGVGECIYVILSNKLADFKRRIDDIQFEYEQSFNLLKTMEMRIRSVSSERDAEWLKMEYQSKRNEFYNLEEMRNDLHEKAERIANLNQVLMDQYDALFPQYFQEVYDADMHDVHVGPYDDSPAGFRLLYKYGRSNTSQWTPVKNPTEFIEALVSFFTATENEIAHTKEFEGMGTELSEVITAIVSHVRSKEFLETAFYRMAVAHNMPVIKDPLENLDRIEKKPWAYTSGGTMSTLVSCYFKLADKPADAARWVESPTELLTFLADTVKQIPPKILEPYVRETEKSMLIHSPTHAFLFKPGRPIFKEIWANDAYTYTWVRDHHILPRQRFIDNIVLDESMMSYVVEKLTPLIPIDFRHYFKRVFGRIHGDMNPPDFREHILDEMQRERGLQVGKRTILSTEDIDSALYSLLPLASRSNLRDILQQIYQNVFTDPNQINALMEMYEQCAQHMTLDRYINATQLQSIAKGLICLAFKTTTADVDYHKLVARAAQNLGYAMPQPILFADTNWVKDEFGFVVNPGTGKLELWRVDFLGTTGYPMAAWRHWLDGSRKEPTWGVYVKPYEYAGV